MKRQKYRHIGNIKSSEWSFGKNWCRLVDSNHRPTHYECVALPTELNRLYIRLLFITKLFDNVNKMLASFHKIFIKTEAW